MAYRFTDTGKWSDGWFIELDPTAKLLFMYICDNCDVAGFFEISPRKIAFDTGIDSRGLEGALKGLQKSLIYSYDGTIVFLKNFVKHQKNLPLNHANKAHRGVIKRLKLYADKFDLKLLGEALKTDVFSLIEVDYSEEKNKEKNEEKPEGALKRDTSPFEGATKGLASPTGIGIGKPIPYISLNKANSIGENIGGMGGKGEEEKIQSPAPGISDPDPEDIPVEEVDPFRDFEEWIDKNAPRLAKMKEPFTREQFERLFSEYQPEDIYSTLEDMHNWTPLLKKTQSANLTCRNWLRNDNKGPTKKGKTQSGSQISQKGYLDRMTDAITGALAKDDGNFKL